MIKVELCAIAHKPRLSPSPKGIAKRLARLLTQSQRAHELGAKFEITEINDPDDFITHIRCAYAISRFWITLSRPNLFDVDSDFIRPMEGLLSSLDGQPGKTEIKCKALKNERLEALARSAASSGDDAAV